MGLSTPIHPARHLQTTNLTTDTQHYYKDGQHFFQNPRDGASLLLNSPLRKLPPLPPLVTSAKVIALQSHRTIPCLHQHIYSSYNITSSGIRRAYATNLYISTHNRHAFTNPNWVVVLALKSSILSASMPS